MNIRFGEISEIEKFPLFSEENEGSDIVASNVVNTAEGFYTRMGTMYRNRWVNETGGGWISVEIFKTIKGAKEDAKFSFENGNIERHDVIQCWEVDDDLEIIGNTASEEWSDSDLGIEWSA